MELFKGQKYANIRKEQTEYGVPWTDPTFPPSDTSIGHSKSSKLPRVVKWLRPSVSFSQCGNFKILLTELKNEKFSVATQNIFRQINLQ